MARGWRVDVNVEGTIPFVLTNKAVHLPNATTLGYGKWRAEPGDFIEFADSEASSHRETGRVLGSVKENAYTVYEGKRIDFSGEIAVLVLGCGMSFAYLRTVKAEDVTECRGPVDQTANGSLGRFLAFMFDVEINAKTIPELLRESRYGSMSDRSVDNAVARIESRGVSCKPAVAKASVPRRNLAGIVGDGDKLAQLVSELNFHGIEVTP